MSAKIRHQLQIESDINQALEQDQFALYAQPQLSPVRVLDGLEILIRWNHPERGLLGPGEFIPHAENSRQIVKIERWVLRKTLEKKVLSTSGVGYWSFRSCSPICSFGRSASTSVSGEHSLMFSRHRRVSVWYS